MDYLIGIAIFSGGTIFGFIGASLLLANRKEPEWWLIHSAIEDVNDKLAKITGEDDEQLHPSLTNTHYCEILPAAVYEDGNGFTKVIVGKNQLARITSPESRLPVAE
jgi:hypothetical protein